MSKARVDGGSRGKVTLQAARDDTGYRVAHDPTRITAMDAEQSSSERLKRKLAVILASDVAGYSRLVSISEDDTIGRFRKAAQTFVQIIEKHEGRVFNTAGDAILAEWHRAGGNPCGTFSAIVEHEFPTNHGQQQWFSE
jgi:class 3 adenylate cyclase